MNRIFCSIIILTASLLPAQEARIDRQHLMSVFPVLQKETGEKRRLLEQRVIDNIRSNKLDFVVTQDLIVELRRAGASEALLEAVRASGLTAADLMARARASLQANRFGDAASEAQQAAMTAPSPEAWAVVAEAKKKAGDLAGAREAILQQVEAGGEVSIPVIVAPAGENFRNPCPGMLIVSPRRLALFCPCRTGFDFADAKLIEVRRNQFVGVDRRAFHITLETAQGAVENDSLAPAETDAAAADWILRAIALYRRN